MFGGGASVRCSARRKAGASFVPCISGGRRRSRKLGLLRSQGHLRAATLLSRSLMALERSGVKCNGTKAKCGDGKAVESASVSSANGCIGATIGCVESFGVCAVQSHANHEPS